MSKPENPRLFQLMRDDQGAVVTDTEIRLLDLFAAAAISKEAYSAYETHHEEIAASAYALAAAMLVERAKRGRL